MKKKQLELGIVVGLDIEQEDDGRYLVSVPDLPGVMCYGETVQEAANAVLRLALEVTLDRLSHTGSVI